MLQGVSMDFSLSPEASPVEALINGTAYVKLAATQPNSNKIYIQPKESASFAFVISTADEIGYDSAFFTLYMEEEEVYSILTENGNVFLSLPEAEMPEVKVVYAWGQEVV